MPHITSAGGILCALHNDVPYLLLLSYQDGRLAFPKGRVDSGETIEDAALREVQEETGCTGLRIVQKLGDISYTPKHPSQVGNTKTMHIYLMQAEDRPQHGEDPTEWVPLATAILTMAKEEERNLLTTHESIIARTLSHLRVE